MASVVLPRRLSEGVSRAQRFRHVPGLASFASSPSWTTHKRRRVMQGDAVSPIPNDANGEAMTQRMTQTHAANAHDDANDANDAEAGASLGAAERNGLGQPSQEVFLATYQTQGTQDAWPTTGI
jgi:hypothetical protein